MPLKHCTSKLNSPVMKLRSCAVVIVLLTLIAPAVTSADTYATFQTTRYYSANRHYFVEVTEKKRATLYRNGRSLRRVWRRTLPDLPGTLLVANDGHRVVVIDNCYGNNHVPTMKAITILGETGKEISSFQLRDVANLERVLHTISTAHWYGDGEFSKDGTLFEVKTVVAKRLGCETVTPEESHECMESVPFEHLRFELATGRLVDRKSISAR